MFNFIYVSLILGFIFVLLLVAYTFEYLGKSWTLKLLFKDFKRKMWMTVSLGGLFFCLYFVVVSLGAYFFNHWGTDLFSILYQHPVEFVYGGLWLFACFSLSIYLVRMMIKYIYLTKGKDS
jgi:hypothetical protein